MTVPMQNAEVSRLLENGQISKMITTHIGRNPLAGELYGNGQLALELVPQGTLAERIRADGAGLGGVLNPGWCQEQK